MGYDEDFSKEKGGDWEDEKDKALGSWIRAQQVEQLVKEDKPNMHKEKNRKKGMRTKRKFVSKEVLACFEFLMMKEIEKQKPQTRSEEKVT